MTKIYRFTFRACIFGETFENTFKIKTHFLLSFCVQRNVKWSENDVMEKERKGTYSACWGIILAVFMLCYSRRGRTSLSKAIPKSHRRVRTGNADIVLFYYLGSGLSFLVFFLQSGRWLEASVSYFADGVFESIGACSQAHSTPPWLIIQAWNHGQSKELHRSFQMPPELFNYLFKTARIDRPGMKSRPIERATS